MAIKMYFYENELSALYLENIQDTGFSFGNVLRSVHYSFNVYYLEVCNVSE